MEKELKEIKARLHVLHDRDDENLLHLLKQGHATVQGYVGEFDIDHPRGRGLVFEWVRFAYNGQAEYFYRSYAGELNMLGFELIPPPDEVEAE